LLVVSGLASLLLLCLHDRAQARERRSTPRVDKTAKAATTKKRVIAPKREGVQAKAAYCVNLADSKVLFSRNSDQTLPVASLTKMVTAMVALDHYPLDRELTAPESVKQTPKSVVGLKPGDKVTVRDLLHGLLIRSGNDCAETLAAAYKGGKSKFVEAMNAKARALGAKRTRFYTPSGLDLKCGGTGENAKVESNVSTAKEIALITREAFSNKVIRAISLKKRYVMKPVDSDGAYLVKSTNKLLKEGLPLEGGKTGYTNKAGHCFASRFCANRSDFIIVVLGSPDHFGDTRRIYREAVKKASGRAPGVRHTTRGANSPAG
jgi:D-alanyl-D-alanine carboxypeptidase